MTAMYYLALVFLLSDNMEPQIMSVPITKEECFTEADKQNRNNPIVRDKKLRDLGIEFVCLKMERLYL